MPYVVIPAVSGENLLKSAEQRWGAVQEARPDLAPALALQRGLLTAVVDLARVLDGGRLPRLSLPPKYLAAKLARGVPALAGEPIPVPVPVVRPTLLQLCDALTAGGAGEATAHIREAIDGNKMDAGSLLTTVLHRDQAAVRTGAAHRGLSPDLVWLVAELAVSPFAHALQRMIFASAGAGTPELAAAVDDWNRGYCPACGSWPAVAEVAAGHRTLRCSFCASAWEPKTYACIYCEESGEPFVTAAPDAERKDRRLELCSTCGGYLKTLDVPELSPFPLLSISDIETTDLDVAAMEHGYARPPLKDFAPRKG
jgi:FdhE protein